MKVQQKRSRLDELVVARGLTDSVQKAQAIILAGEVFVDGQRVNQAGAQIAGEAAVEFKSRQEKYASRGGFKLEGALADFAVSAAEKVCLDVGASTGGFTDCLLQHGAKRVYAVDVNSDQMAWKLRQDARVVLVKKNARELAVDDIREAVDLVLVDVSFISAEKVLPGAVDIAKSEADFLILVKPQFELEREEVGPGGIVTDETLHQKAISIVQRAAENAGLTCLGVKPSRLTGAEGNQEYFLHARKKLEE